MAEVRVERYEMVNAVNDKFWTLAYPVSFGPPRWCLRRWGKRGTLGQMKLDVGPGVITDVIRKSEDKKKAGYFLKTEHTVSIEAPDLEQAIARRDEKRVASLVMTGIRSYKFPQGYFFDLARESGT